MSDRLERCGALRGIAFAVALVLTFVGRRYVRHVRREGQGRPGRAEERTDAAEGAPR